MTDRGQDQWGPTDRQRAGPGGTNAGRAAANTALETVRAITRSLQHNTARQPLTLPELSPRIANTTPRGSHSLCPSCHHESPTQHHEAATHSARAVATNRQHRARSQLVTPSRLCWSRRQRLSIYPPHRERLARSSVLGARCSGHEARSSKLGAPRPGCNGGHRLEGVIAALEPALAID